VRTPAVWLALAGLMGAWGVGAAAWAAHGIADPHARGLIETASRILLAHAAALPGLCALLSTPSARLPPVPLALAGWLVALGAFLFAAGVHGSALGGPRVLSAAAPWGGSAMIVGWLVVVAAGVAGVVRRS